MPVLFSRLRLRAALAGVPAAFALAAGALATPSPDPSAPPAIGHVVTSDRRNEPLSATSRPTFVIDRATIEAFGARTVGDALRSAPGVNIFSYGGFGAQNDYGIRGTTSEQTMVLLDGVPIATASSGEIDLGSLTTIGVDRIEIVESGGSTLYGAGATGGVINIITSVPRGAYFAVAGGSYDDQDLRAAFGAGPVGLSIERHVAGNAFGYPAFNYGNGASCNAITAPCLPAATRINAFALQNAARLDFDLPLIAGWSARGGAGLSSTSIGVPGRIDFIDPTANQHVSRFDGVANIIHAGAASESTITLAGSRQDLSYLDLSPAFGGQSDTYDSRTQLSLRNSSGDRNVVTYGLDLERESANLSLGPGGPPSSFAASEAQSALYAQQTVAFGGSRLYAGLRGENDSPHGSVLAPALGGTAALGAFKLSANAGESYRVPTLVELYYPGFSNPDLVPERATNVDATLALPVPAGNVSLGWFGRYASNLITLNGNFVPVNTQQAIIGGAILTAQLQPRPFLVTAGVMNIYRAIDESPGAGGARLQRIPVFTGTLDVERPVGRDRYGYGLRLGVAGGDHDNGGYPGVVTFYDGRTTLDLYARYQIAAPVVLTVRARNVGNAQYAPVFGYPSPGRTLEIEFASR